MRIFLRQPKFWKKEGTGGTGLMTNMKMDGKEVFFKIISKKRNNILI